MRLTVTLGGVDVLVDAMEDHTLAAIRIAAWIQYDPPPPIGFWAIRDDRGTTLDPLKRLDNYPHVLTTRRLNIGLSLWRMGI